VWCRTESLRHLPRELINEGKLKSILFSRSSRTDFPSTSTSINHEYDSKTRKSTGGASRADSSIQGVAIRRQRASRISSDLETELDDHVDKEALPIFAHPVYYFTDGNMVFLAENCLFKLHRSILSHHSKLFCDKFVNQSRYELSDVKSVAFECLLRVVFPL
jgi:hypothetical protein